jgi:hypothetical protein
MALDLIKDAPPEDSKQKWCWVCRTCGLEGPWVNEKDLDKKIPRGWKDDPSYGLRCGACTKANKIS